MRGGTRGCGGFRPTDYRGGGGGWGSGGTGGRCWGGATVPG